MSTRTRGQRETESGAHPEFSQVWAPEYLSGRRGSNSRPLPWQGTFLILYSGGAENGVKATTYPQFPPGSTLTTREAILITRRCTLTTNLWNRGERRYVRRRGSLLAHRASVVSLVPGASRRHSSARTRPHRYAYLTACARSRNSALLKLLLMCVFTVASLTNSPWQPAGCSAPRRPPRAPLPRAGSSRPAAPKGRVLEGRNESAIAGAAYVFGATGLQV